MPRLQLTHEEQVEYTSSAKDAFTEDLVKICEAFRKRLAEIGLNATEINYVLREELEDVKEAFR